MAATDLRQSPSSPGPALGYLIPEFPGQTHVWMWREMTHLRAWGASIRVFSTRRPPPRDRARHGFAAAAEAATDYLHPPSPPRALAALGWAASTRPGALGRCVRLAATLPIEGGARGRAGLLALVAPACALALAARREKLEHLHAHTCGRGAVLCMMARLLTGVPFSMTLNADLRWWGGAMAEKIAASRFTVAITRGLREQVARDLPPQAAGRCLLGGIGVDTRRWDPASSAALAARQARRPEDPARVVTVARLHPSKGHDDLIAAVATLARAGRAVELRLVGDGPQRAELEALALAAGLGERARFLGSLSEDDVLAEVAAADVFALASHAEPLGVAYMEAMALEVPVVGTAAGGVGEIVTPGLDGLLVPPRDPASLAAAIASLLDDPSRRLAIAAAGRRTVVERFDSRLGAATLYEQITGRPPPAESC